MAQATTVKRGSLEYVVTRGGLERRWIVTLSDGRTGVTAWGPEADRKWINRVVPKAPAIYVR